jgi:hypothetical protein
MGTKSAKLTLLEHLSLLRGSCCSIFSFRRSNLWMIVCFKVIKKISENEYRGYAILLLDIIERKEQLF